MSGYEGRADVTRAETRVLALLLAVVTRGRLGKRPRIPGLRSTAHAAGCQSGAPAIAPWLDLDCASTCHLHARRFRNCACSRPSRISSPTSRAATKHPAGFDHDDYRLAAAALLVHAAVIDGNFSEAEQRTLRALLQQRFALDDAATDELIAQATAAEQESVDLYQFTRLLNGTLDEEGRARVIEMMWQVAYADGHVSEFQDNLIWRAADLLGVSSRERIALRQRIAEARKGGTG